MGRGRSKANGGSGGGSQIKTQITTQDGTVLDLTDTPLVYGPKDTAVTGAVRTAIEAQEQKRLKAKTEYGLMLDKNGNPIGTEVHGGKGSVRMPWRTFQNPGGVFTHNHPRGKGEEGCLGGTFSEADLKTFAGNPFWTIRASAAEGTYSMTKSLSFNRSGFQSYVRNINSQANAKYKKANSQLASDARAGKISFSEYNKKATAAFNSFLVEVHNGLLAGQKQYGYHYTLEGR